MKLVCFTYGKTDGYGVLKGEEILSLPALSDATGLPLPRTLEELVSQGMEGVKAVEKLLKDSTETDMRRATLKTSMVAFKAPLQKPPKIVCLGLNYRDHLAEQGSNRPQPKAPILFMKPRTAIIGPCQDIVKPAMVSQLDYEAELAVIMGRKGRNIPAEKASEYVFGYTIMNDVSARDIQFSDGQWTRGKSFDTFAPIGPAIVLADQIKNPDNLRIRAWVNNQPRQDSSTSNMFFNTREIIHQLSLVMTLEPADIIATGTPAGVGAFMKPQPRFLQDGDIVEIEIENIGTLRNRVVEEKPL